MILGSCAVHIMAQVTNSMDYSDCCEGKVEPAWLSRAPPKPPWMIMNRRVGSVTFLRAVLMQVMFGVI